MAGAAEALEPTMVKESVIYQDILLKGWRQGWQEGWQKRRGIWIQYLLKRSLIDNKPVIFEQIRRLSPSQLETILTFSQADELKAWLQQQQKCLSDRYLEQQSRREGEMAWIRYKLEERLEKIDRSVLKPLLELSVPELEILAQEFCSFLLAEDLVAWLEEKVKLGSQPWFYQSLLQKIVLERRSLS